MEFTCFELVQGKCVGKTVDLDFLLKDIFVSDNFVRESKLLYKIIHF